MAAKVAISNFISEPLFGNTCPPFILTCILIGSNARNLIDYTANPTVKMAATLGIHLDIFYRSYYNVYTFILYACIVHDNICCPNMAATTAMLDFFSDKYYGRDKYIMSNVGIYNVGNMYVVQVYIPRTTLYVAQMLVKNSPLGRQQIYIFGRH